MKGILLFSLLTICCIACNVMETNVLINIPIEEVYVDTQNETFLASDQYVVDKVVELKLSENLDITMCKKIRFVKDHCYILDEGNRKVFVFDGEGKMISALGRVGRAADEICREPADFAVDKETMELYLFDSYGRKILKYDSLGKYISTNVNKSINSHAFARQKNGNLVYSFSYKEDKFSQLHELATYTSIGDKINGYLPIERNHSFISTSTFSESYDNVAYIQNISDMVYIIDADTISSGIHFSFNSRCLTTEERNSALYDGDFPTYNSDELCVLYLREFSENEYWRYMSYYLSSYLYRFIQNKKSGQCYNIPYSTGFLPFISIGISNDKIVFLVLTDDIEMILSFKDECSPEEWNKYYNESSPIIQQLLDGELKAPCLIYMTLP